LIIIIIFTVYTWLCSAQGRERLGKPVGGRERGALEAEEWTFGARREGLLE
jgi:hypothetical protein